MAYTERMRGKGVILTGDADGVADTPLAVIPDEDGMTVTLTWEDHPFKVNGYSGNVAVERDLMSVKVETASYHFNAATIAHGLGLTSTGAVQLGGDSPTALKERSVKVILTRVDGQTIVVDIPAAMASGDLAIAAARADYSKVPIVLESLDGASRGATIKVAGGSANATVSTGVLTRPAGIGYLRIFGEGDAADAVDSITGTGLTNLEVLVLQLGKAGNTITLVHLLDTLEIATLANHDIVDLGDFVVVQYLSADTAWHEIGRYVKPQPA